MEFPRRLKNRGQKYRSEKDDVKHTTTGYFSAQNSLGLPVHLEQKPKS